MVTIEKDMLFFHVPVWNSGQSTKKSMLAGKYRLSFDPPDWANYELVNYEAQLPTTYQVQGGRMTVSKIVNMGQGKVAVYVDISSPPLVYLIGGLGALGLSAYNLYKVEKVMSLPLTWVAVAGAIYLYLKLK